MDQLSCMRIFSRVAERSSFSHAADDLGLSRAVVSTAVAALEQHLGVRLLNRTTRRVTLTVDGSEYQGKCRRILAEVAAADDSLRRGRARVQGRLRVDVPALFGRYLLLPALANFTERYPDLALEIQYNDRIVDLVAERIDLSVRFARVSQGDLIARKVGSTRLITCVSPSYLAKHGPVQSPEDLRAHSLIGLGTASPGRARDWAFRFGTQTRRMTLPCRFIFNSVDAMLQAGIAGHGVLQTAALVAAGAVAEAKLQVILSPWTVDGPPVSIVYSRANRDSVKVRVFADFLADLFQSWASNSVAYQHVSRAAATRAASAR
jgi:LysR family transcriptional regulator for bpeEF and oprC